jgi:hypothetical protein
MATLGTTPKVIFSTSLQPLPSLLLGRPELFPDGALPKRGERRIDRVLAAIEPCVVRTQIDVALVLFWIGIEMIEVDPHVAKKASAPGRAETGGSEQP